MLATAEKGSLLPLLLTLMPCIRELLGDHLYDSDPSPARPDMKKHRPDHTFDLKGRNPLGCGDESDEELRVQTLLDKVPNFHPE
ncbi:hypothetical protein KC19_VG200200 [Ceratodon purpureus]|uniref:Uncharacterized protein n=1 Tax=Ceratodon purpureus TaxID=3225 RepID=A0A8T0HRU0_CERPU|nr:hypothetical protein KC19_VG200200 [Ceratodon purpureus]